MGWSSDSSKRDMLNALGLASSGGTSSTGSGSLRAGSGSSGFSPNRRFVNLFLIDMMSTVASFLNYLLLYMGRGCMSILGCRKHRNAAGRMPRHMRH